MSEDQESIRRPKRGRSPSYPGISLAEAEKRARALYDAERTHPAPIGAIAEHWGYGPKSGGAKTILAALKKFGLIEDHGSGDDRHAGLTELGAELVLSPDPSEVRKEAALLPRFHREMWDEYGVDLPSRANLRYRLIREFDFTERGAQEFLDEYEETIAYAGLGAEDRDESESENVADESDGPGAVAEQTIRQQVPGQTAVPIQKPAADAVPVAPAPGPGAMVIPIPLLGEGPIYLSGDFPLSEAGWVQMMRVLEAMRPGLVSPEMPPKSDLPPTASPLQNAPGEADGGLRRPQYGIHDG